LSDRASRSPTFRNGHQEAREAQAEPRPDEARPAGRGAGCDRRQQADSAQPGHKKLWDYIKQNGLQDAKVRTNINADDALKAVFNGKATSRMFEMTKLVSTHIKNA